MSDLTNPGFEDIASKKTGAAAKKGLGRGLGSLLGGGSVGAQAKSPETRPVGSQTNLPAPSISEKSASVSTTELKPVKTEQKPIISEFERIMSLPIEQVQPCKNQPRRQFLAEPLNELANSIREKGILQPIVVRKLDGDEGSYEILAGERRWRAAQLAGLQKIPAILKKTNDQEALELALIENIQRENLNPLEEAEAYKYLIDEYDLTQQELAKRVGKDRATVANLMRLLNLKSDVRALVREQKLSLGHAKVLLAVEDNATQGRLANQIIKKQWSVRETERQVKKIKSLNNGVNFETASEHRAQDQLAAKALVEKLKTTLGTQIDLSYSKGKGSLSIHFYSDEQLHHLVERLQS